MSEYLPSTMVFIRRMRTFDPSYPSERHQLAFVWRYDQWQRRHPCAIDHEHSSKCYPEKLLNEVYADQKMNGHR